MTSDEKLIKMFSESTIEVSLPNKLGYERVAMACSATFAKIVGFLPERVEDLKTAVSEACLNAMEHGNLNRPDRSVLVRMNYSDHVFSVSVMDQGEGMKETPEIPDDLDIDKKIEALEIPRGIGMFLIKQLVDQVEFNQLTNEGHMVRMLLRLEG
jgi:serine/threonine-protein kinase RsbW